MLYIVPAIGASLAYSSDVIFARLALENMNMYVFIFILAACYCVVAISLLFYKYDEISQYFSQQKNTKYTYLAIAAIIIGTIIGDLLAWYAIQESPRKYLPIAVALIHTVPVLSLILVIVFYKEILNWKAIVGIIMSVVGCAIAVLYSGHTIDQIA